VDVGEKPRVVGWSEDELVEVTLAKGGKVKVFDSPIAGLVRSGERVNFVGVIFPEETEGNEVAFLEVDQGFDTVVNARAHTQRITEGEGGCQWVLGGVMEGGVA